MFGVSDEIDVSIGTMSKAIGSHGGFVACSGAMKRVLASSARSAIFSTSLPAPVVAAASAALEVDRSVGHEARTKLYARIDAFAAACAGRIRARHVATTCGHVMTDDAVNEWRGVFVTRKSPVVSVVVGSESVALRRGGGVVAAGVSRARHQAADGTGEHVQAAGGAECVARVGGRAGARGCGGGPGQRRRGRVGGDG